MQYLTTPGPDPSFLTIPRNGLNPVYAPKLFFAFNSPVNQYPKVIGGTPAILWIGAAVCHPLTHLTEENCAEPGSFILDAINRFAILMHSSVLTGIP